MEQNQNSRREKKNRKETDCCCPHDANFEKQWNE